MTVVCEFVRREARTVHDAPVEPTPTATTDGSDGSGNVRALMRRLASVMSHPLILIGVGAIVSGLLVPVLTRGAQNHQQALEIQRDLVNSISADTSPFFAATHANELVHRGRVPRSYDLAYQRWDARSNEIWTKLRTYYPDNDLPGECSALRQRVRGLYYFFRLPSGGDGPAARRFYLRGLEEILEGMPYCGPRGVSQPCPPGDLDTLEPWLTKPTADFSLPVDIAMHELLDAFAFRVRSILDDILATDPQV
ncbi:MAG: hypothetical protein QOJ89_727 [bacterium]